MPMLLLNIINNLGWRRFHYAKQEKKSQYLFAICIMDIKVIGGLVEHHDIRQFGEQLGALRVGAPLAVHDVLEFRMAGHGIVFCAF